MKDHYIPCLLMSQFSVDGRVGRKARVFQLRKDGPHPEKAVAAENLAYARGFYASEEFPDLDKAGLHVRERDAARVIRSVASGADPSQCSADLALLVAIQAARTKALRQWGTSRFGDGLDRILATLRSPRGVASVRRWVGRKILDGDQQVLQRLGIEEPLAALFVAMRDSGSLADGLIESAIEPVTMLVAQLMGQQLQSRDKIEASVGRGQIKGLHSLLQGMPDDHPLALASWSRIDATAEPLVLGDGCLVAVSRSGEVGWMSRFGTDWAEVYLPISRRCAVVGIAQQGPGAPTLSVRDLNVASAELSRRYVYASRCTGVELSLAARIGTREPALSDEEMDAQLDDLFGRASLDG